MKVIYYCPCAMIGADQRPELRLFGTRWDAADNLTREEFDLYHENALDVLNRSITEGQTPGIEVATKIIRFVDAPQEIREQLGLVSAQSFTMDDAPVGVTVTTPAPLLV